jgi:signal transduction histidine kinase
MLNQELEARVDLRTPELIVMSERLNEARNVEILRRLTGGIAHDLNNLLTAIQGNLELLAKRLSDQRLKRYCDNARVASERAARLVTELLESSGPQRLVAKPVDVNALVRDIGEPLSGTLGDSIRIETILHSALWPAMADPIQLELVVLEIAINARDAMPLGGVLTIETFNTSVGETQGSPEVPSPGEYVSLAIADTGTGMTDEVRARAFEPFFTTKAMSKGSGLGLTQSLGIAKQLGGGMRIESKKGQGTRVEVLLPRARQGHPEVPPETYG